MLVEPIKRRFTVEEYDTSPASDRGVTLRLYAQAGTVQVVPRAGRLSPAALPDVRIAAAEIL